MSYDAIAYTLVQAAFCGGRLPDWLTDAETHQLLEEGYAQLPVAGLRGVRLTHTGWNTARQRRPDVGGYPAYLRR